MNAKDIDDIEERDIVPEMTNNLHWKDASEKRPPQGMFCGVHGFAITDATLDLSRPRD
jgi:hypothetical protein